MSRHMKVEHKFRGWVTRTTTETWLVDVVAADFEAADVKIQEAMDSNFENVDGKAELDYTSTETELTVTEEIPTELGGRKKWMR